MLLYVFEPRARRQVEGVDAVVTALLIAGVVDATAGYDGHVRPLAHEEVVVHHLGVTRLAEDDGDMDALVLGAGLDDNVNTGFVRLGDNIDILGGVAARHLAVGADIIGALGHLVQIGDLL